MICVHIGLKFHTMSLASEDPDVFIDEVNADIRRREEKLERLIERNKKFNVSGANKMDEQKSIDEGFSIKFDRVGYENSKDIIVSGSFSIFVNCGSQYALWHQFPAGIRFTVKDLDSDAEYLSANTELSISWDGNQIYEEYAKMPCNTAVGEDFSMVLNDMYFERGPNKEIVNFELRAAYAGKESNVLTFIAVPFIVKGF